MSEQKEIKVGQTWKIGNSLIRIAAIYPHMRIVGNVLGGPVIAYRSVENESDLVYLESEGPFYKSFEFVAEKERAY